MNETFTALSTVFFFAMSLVTLALACLAACSEECSSKKSTYRSTLTQKSRRRLLERSRSASCFWGLFASVWSHWTFAEHRLRQTRAHWRGNFLRMIPATDQVLAHKIRRSEPALSALLADDQDHCTPIPPEELDTDQEAQRLLDAGSSSSPVNYSAIQDVDTDITVRRIPSGSGEHSTYSSFADFIPLEVFDTYQSFKRFLRSNALWRRDFFFSTRFLTAILCGTAASFLSCSLMYVFLFRLSVRQSDIFVDILSLCDALEKQLLLPQIKCPVSHSSLKLLLDALSDYTFYIAAISVALTFLILILTFSCMIVEYRSNILQMRRGHYFFRHKKVKMFASTRLVGYQSAFAAVGSLCLSAVVFSILIVIGIALMSTVLFPLTVSQLILQTPLVQFLVGISLVSLFRLVGIRIISLFVMRRGRITRRRLFDVIEVFMTVYAAFTGAATCVLWRLIVPIMLRLLELPRADRSGFSLGYHKDASFTAYLACLMMDHHYSNPVLLLFFDCLQDDAQRLQAREEDIITRDAGKRVKGANEDDSHRKLLSERKMLRRQRLFTHFFVKQYIQRHCAATTKR
eukprot:CAMPEP_0117443392 /NCGR_PEP_ID=MMETSP0759-20121206/4671_1 /TAXON_ID=63605 /ORGANISM="Percolomonas cosmopolitus, Strain WS" /LENGTH=572 /DNA_ID=CAMNT_0005235365 /DNA_START=389 /DNA_END=2107 /DNA_ORIENTATION=+